MPIPTYKVPGPKAAEYIRRDATFISPSYPRDVPFVMHHGRGSEVWDVDGNRFLDLTSGFGVAGLGYTPEKIVAAVQDQVARLYHAMGDVHPHALKAQLARELSRITFERWSTGGGRRRRLASSSPITHHPSPKGKTIFCNSGFEAVEAALKLPFFK